MECRNPRLVQAPPLQRGRARDRLVQRPLDPTIRGRLHVLINGRVVGSRTLILTLHAFFEHEHLHGTLVDDEKPMIHASLPDEVVPIEVNAMLHMERNSARKTMVNSPGVWRDVYG